MRPARILLLLVVVAAVVALAMSFDGRPAATGDGEVERSVVPVAGEPGSLSSTWYCAAGGATAADPLQQFLYLFNPSGEPATAQLTAYGPEGVVGTPQQVELSVPGPTVVDATTLFGAPGASVMVESGAGELVVEHRVAGPGNEDQVPCATRSSDLWFFPAQTTVRDTSAQLTLFNPFPEDASVDISAAVDDGVREPPEWQGLVVPAGTARVVDLGVAAVRREQFSVTVQARNGQVVAESAQTLATPASGDIPATSGLRLQLGVPEARADWTFAEGFTGTGANERLVLFNPGDRPATVLVQVTPYGGAELPPEPFELEVPARRYAQLDLSAETRIPGEGLHAIRVQTGADTPVVSARVVTVVGAGAAPSTPQIVARPATVAGTSIGTGTPVAAALWAATGLSVGNGQEQLVAVHNPSSDTVRVSATVLGGAADGTVLADALEVAPGDSLAIRADDPALGVGDVTVVVEADAPVVVERSSTAPSAGDFSMGLAVPLPTERLVLSVIGR
jgi:hypothetical protein